MHRSDESNLLRPLSSVPVPRLGVIGGGQLAKMTAAAAASFGCEVVVFERQDDFPAHSLDTHAIIGDWDCPEDLLRLAPLVDVITLENEFVSADALSVLADNRHTILPSAETLMMVQDKYVQKSVFAQAGLPLAQFADAPSMEDVRRFDFPAVLKKRRNSYDGKGNATVLTEGELSAAWKTLDGDRCPLYVERLYPFAAELAIIVTRGRGGESVQYPVVETINREHICHVVKAPADVSPTTKAQVAEYAKRAVAAIGGVGSFGVEFFLSANGTVVLNEIAPRVHNTGHYTIEACVCSQFENHVRAILGWPLGSTAMVSPGAAMVNLLGYGDGPGTPVGLEQALGVQGAHIHIYGKARSARGRKMGHVTALGASADEALLEAQRAADCIRFGGQG
ncbi:MAG: 5-(carboxyamino)imidazole ribonucleotide synthase [Candidatus Hydrogenedentes bacterium]|nr:5-(carboxyamino)imidazole ribonucleotide synthase [Candidatus Hydrogenedentota bacterium]